MTALWSSKPPSLPQSSLTLLLPCFLTWEMVYIGWLQAWSCCSFKVLNLSSQAYKLTISFFQQCPCIKMTFQAVGTVRHSLIISWLKPVAHRLCTSSLCTSFFSLPAHWWLEHKKKTKKTGCATVGNAHIRHKATAWVFQAVKKVVIDGGLLCFPSQIPSLSCFCFWKSLLFNPVLSFCRKNRTLYFSWRHHSIFI